MRHERDNEFIFQIVSISVCCHCEEIPHCHCERSEAKYRTVPGEAISHDNSGQAPQSHIDMRSLRPAAAGSRDDKSAYVLKVVSIL